MSAGSGSKLIEELAAEPQAFFDGGRTYELLQCYFDGLPKDTLVPLLRSDDVVVRRAAAFVVSELGIAAQELLPEVVSLMESGDRYSKYQAMESLTVCAEDEEAEHFFHVPLELESEDAVLRKLAMRLISRAEGHQLAAAARCCGQQPGGAEHERCLTVLANGTGDIGGMLREPSGLVRRYGAVLARRLEAEHPGSVSAAIGITDDPELLEFLRDGSPTLEH